MEKNNTDLNLRSDEIHELMQRPPIWIVRWGITVIFSLLLSGLYLSWLIRYPDLVSGPMRITSSREPIKILSQISGNLMQINVKDGEEVKEGTVLAEIENPVSEKSVRYVKNYNALLEAAVQRRDNDLPLPDTSMIALGDLQPIFSNLRKEIVSYNLAKRYRISDTQLSEVKQHIEYQKQLIVINKNLLQRADNEVEASQQKVEADKRLLRDSMISKRDYVDRESELRTKQLQRENLQKTGLDYSIALSQLELQFSQLQYDKATKDSSLLESISAYRQNIGSFIYGWQQRYSLIAPRSGKVSFLQHIQPHRFTKAGEELFAVVLDKESYIALAMVPMSGAGKLKLGQPVNIQLDGYPFYDHGILSGVVQNIALFPNGSEYRVEISMPTGMASSMKEEIPYTPDMAGVAEIVTEDKRVLERMFDSILKLLKGKK